MSVSETLRKIRGDISRVSWIDPVQGNALKARYANLVNSYHGRGIIGKGEAEELVKADTSPPEEERKGVPELKNLDDIATLALRRSDGTWLGFVKQFRLLCPTMAYQQARKFCSKHWQAKKQAIQRGKVLTDQKTWDLIEPSGPVPISNANNAVGAEENKYEKSVNDIGGAGVSGAGSGEITPKIKKWLEDYGDWKIKNIIVGRNPIISAISSALKLVAVKPFDQLFHLYLILTLQKDNDSKKFVLEKNHLVQAYPASSGDESPKAKMNVNVGKDLNLKDFLSRGEHSLKPKVFWTYDGFNGSSGTNCQLFAWSLLKANGLGSEAIRKFIMQEVKDLVPGWVKRFAKKVTDVAATVGEKVNGGGYSLHHKEPIGGMINHEQEAVKAIVNSSNNTSAKEMRDIMLKKLPSARKGKGLKFKLQPVSEKM